MGKKERVAEHGRGVNPLIRIGLLGLLLVFASVFTPIAGVATEAKDMLITIDFVETHDRLDPDPWPNISNSVTIEATLSADGKVHEQIVSAFTKGKRRMKPAFMERESDEKLGDTATKVVWRVQGPHKLQRLLVGKQFLMMMDVDVEDSGACSVQIKYLLQKGYSDVIMRRRDNGELANFSLPKVVQSSCSIQ